MIVEHFPQTQTNDPLRPRPKVIHTFRRHPPKKASYPNWGRLGHRRNSLERTVQSIAYQAILLIHMTTAEYCAPAHPTGYPSPHALPATNSPLRPRCHSRGVRPWHTRPGYRYSFCHDGDPHTAASLPWTLVSSRIFAKGIRVLRQDRCSG
jgi:hypothetical protein